MCVFFFPFSFHVIHIVLEPLSSFGSHFELHARTHISFSPDAFSACSPHSFLVSAASAEQKSQSERSFTMLHNQVMHINIEFFSLFMDSVPWDFFFELRL